MFVIDVLKTNQKPLCRLATSVPRMTVTVGALTIDACAARAVVPTNVVLLELIACLAARVEECCATAPAQGNDVPLDLTSQ